MHERLALKLLRQLMSWDEETATREYRWIRLVSRMKYDGYRDYLAGVRFAESLAGWLTQFAAADRPVAYAFIKNRLVYFSPPEIQRLVEQLYPRFVAPRLRQMVSSESGTPEYLVWGKAASERRYRQLQRQTMFVGLSDGARLDQFRRANAGMLVNEQVVLATHIDDEKWSDLAAKLRKSALFSDAAETPLFRSVYLVDDFTGSGTSFLRKNKRGVWDGKAVRFWKNVSHARANLTKQGDYLPLSEDFSVHVHHYVSSMQAHNEISGQMAAVAADQPADWYHAYEVSEGLLLPAAIKLSPETDPDIWRLADSYYDGGLNEEMKEALEAAQQTEIKFGYGNSALPLVLEHNCPNNALTLLWAETNGTAGPAMRPLFPRRHRHG